jgi:uncharacterized protein YndB with AHSA1/START domain
MPHEFSYSRDVDLPADPEQVWEAIATGPGVDSWFMGRNHFDAKEGGAGHITIGGQTEHSTITAWEPPSHFAYRTADNPDGTFMAFDFLIEGRGGGTTTLRIVQNGMLGDDWETEFEAMKAGWPLYIHSLDEYLRYFAGRTATGVFAVRPGSPAQPSWAKIKAALGLGDEVSAGDPAHITEPDGALVHGVVDAVSMPHFLGVRADDALYRFIHGGADRGDAIVIGHHLFRDFDPDEADRAWQDWLNQLLSA